MDFEPSERLRLLRQLTEAVAEVERLNTENGRLSRAVGEHDAAWISLGEVIDYHGHPMNMVSIVRERLKRPADKCSEQGPGGAWCDRPAGHDGLHRSTTLVEFH